MAGEFHPTQFGAVAVEDQPFDPTAHGAILVQEPLKQEGGVLSGVASAIGSAINPINLVKGALGLGQPSDISNIIRYGKTLGEIVTGTKPDVAIGQNIPELQQEREAVYGQRGTKAQAEALTGIGLQLGLAAAPFVHGKTLLEAPSLAKVAEPLIGVKAPSTPMEAATEPVPAEPTINQDAVNAHNLEVTNRLVEANKKLAPITEPPSATEVAPEPFPSISQGAEEQRRTELQQPQPTQVREAISLDEIRLMRERDELQSQNEIAQKATGTTHPAVDERLGQIDEELTNIANTELQKAAAEQKPPEPEGVTNAVEPSNAQVETGQAPLRIEERPTSPVAAASSSDNALREAQGAAEPGKIPARQGTEARTQEAATGITPEAQDLITKGGVPAFVSKNLKRIATENGVEVGNKTPNEIIDELKAKSTPPTGISNQRLTEAYGDSAPVATTGRGPGAWKDEGLSRLDNFQKTGDVKNDPYTVLTNLRTKGVPPEQLPSDISLLRAEHQRLLEDARNAEGTPEYQAKSQAALDMATAIKGVAHGPASDVFRALQEYDKPRYDNVTDFDQALRERENRESTSVEKTQFKKIASDVSTTRNGAEKTISDVQKRISKFPKMSFDEAAKNIRDQFTELTKDCGL